MQFTTSFLALACAFSAIGFAAAAPAPEASAVAEPSFEKRQTGHIYICTEGGFSGECDNYAVSSGVCTNFPGGYDKQISSWGPDQGWLCTTWTDYNCSGGETYTGSSPGFSSLPPGIDNNLSSVTCWLE